MHISLSPVRMDTPLRVERRGDTLILNGESLDLSAITEGTTVTAAATGCPWLAGDVTRQGGALWLTILLPHGADAPEQTLFPQALALTADGPVPLPPYAQAETDQP